MQNSQPFSSPSKDPLLDSSNQAGDFMLNSPIIPPSFGGGTVFPPSRSILPFQGVEFQPSEVCPRNFIIFDKTDNRSKIMFHPAIGAKFCYAAAAAYENSRGPFYALDKDMQDDAEESREVVTSSTLKEDLEDIDALLSFDDEHDECDDDNDEEEEEEVSTARTDMNYGCNSPDSCSNYESAPPRKIRHTTNSSLRRKISGCNGSDVGGYNERKRLKMRKMVRALRGKIPGGAKQMNSVAVLDEAVRYLKSLKVEVKKMGGVGKLQSSHG